MLIKGSHNHHHAHPVSAGRRMAWYELDISNLQILLFEKLGIAKAVYAPNLADLAANAREVTGEALPRAA